MGESEAGIGAVGGLHGSVMRGLSIVKISIWRIVLASGARARIEIPSHLLT